MKQRSVVLNGGSDGSDYTIIRASIGAHLMRVYEDGARTHQFVYKKKSDNFTQSYTTDVGDILEIRGNGLAGIIGRPPNYSASGTPASTAPATGDSGGGDIVLMIKASTTSTPSVVVYESEAPSPEAT